MSKVVLVINDQGQQRTLTQSGRNQNNFKEETEGAAADHDFRLEIRDKDLVFIKDKQIHSVVCSLKDVVLKKTAGQNDAQHTPRRQQTTNGSSNTLERAKRIPLPRIKIQSIASVEEAADYPRSPIFILSPSRDSSDFTSADDSGFSIDSDGTYSFGDGSPNKVRGRFQIASGEWELVLSEDPDAINLSITPKSQGRFLSPSESSESRLPGSPSAGASEESLTDTLVNSPSSAGESKKLRMDHYRLRF